jgi:sugar/nucleoside kinase (ribokinase family)
MKLDLLAVSEPMVDIYHAPMSDSDLRDLGLEPGEWRPFDPASNESWDLFNKIRALPVEKVTPGSSPGNVASSLAVLGHSVGLLTAVGDDDNGQVYRQRIIDYGMADYSQIVDEGKNAFVHVLITPRERTFFSYGGCTEKISFESTIPDAKLVYCSGYEVRMFGDRLIEYISNSSGKICFDIAAPNIIEKGSSGFEAMKDRASILFASADEYKSLYGEHFSRSSPFKNGKNLEVLVLKKGAKGSEAFDRRGGVSPHVFSREDISDEDFVNTCGAGDAYAAGFLSAMLRGDPVEEAGLIGTYVAGMVIRQHEPYLLL